MKKGFTFAEIMVVVAICGLLLAVVVPLALSDSKQTKRSERNLVVWDSTVGYIQTIDYGGHKFISFGSNQVLHHPDCKCKETQQ